VYLRFKHYPILPENLEHRKLCLPQKKDGKERYLLFRHERLFAIVGKFPAFGTNGNASVPESPQDDFDYSFTGQAFYLFRFFHFSTPFFSHNFEQVFLGFLEQDESNFQF